MSSTKSNGGKNMGLIQGYDFPDELYYSKKHIWVKFDSDGVAILGLTDFARKNVDDVVLIELFLKEGSQIQCNKPFGALDSAKGTQILYSPLSGKIEKRNRKIMMDPSALTNAPYTLGWCIKLSPSSLEEELTSLMKGGSPELFEWFTNEIKKFK
jgi:glycine cleavage system H protein